MVGSEKCFPELEWADKSAPYMCCGAEGGWGSWASVVRGKVRSSSLRMEGCTRDGDGAWLGMWSRVTITFETLKGVTDNVWVVWMGRAIGRGSMRKLGNIKETEQDTVGNNYNMESQDPNTGMVHGTEIRETIVAFIKIERCGLEALWTYGPSLNYCDVKQKWWVSLTERRGATSLWMRVEERGGECKGCGSHHRGHWLAHGAA